MLLIVLFLNARVACSFSNCGCGYDGGDCCKKTVTGGKVNTKYWLVSCIVVFLYRRTKL